MDENKEQEKASEAADTQVESKTQSTGQRADKLYRSQQDRMIGGVAGGLAKYFNIDPVLVRIGFFALAFVNGIGVFIYIILWLTIQNDPSETPNQNNDRSEKFRNMAGEVGERFQEVAHNLRHHNENTLRRRNIFGGILVLLGLAALSSQSFGWLFSADIFLPAVLIIVGLYIILKGDK